MKRSTVLLGLAGLVVLALLAGRFYLSEADFGVTNPSWNGLYGMAQGMGARPLYDTSGLSAINNTSTLLVIGPAENYTLNDSLEVASFLQSGGLVVVADDFGNADSLLDGLGAPIAINRAALCQYENYSVNQSFPIITDIAPTPYTANVSELVLNHPSALDTSGDAQVLAATSRDAWIDTNNNYILDNDERMGVFPVAASYEYGAGQLIVVSDPDVFINGMLDKGDNRAFMQGLLQGDVWVDASHGQDIPPLGILYYAVRYDILAQAGVLVLVLALCLALLKRGAILKFLSGLNKRNN